MIKIIILGGSILQLPIIKEAKRLGLFVIVVDMDSTAVGKKYSDKFYNYSTLDKENILRISREEGISSIITAASDKPMYTVGYVSDQLNFDIISQEVVENATNKFEMRKILSRSNLPVPLFKKIKNLEELLEFIQEYSSSNYDFILKPIDNSGSRGIKYLPSNALHSEIVNSFKYTCQFSNSDYILVEEYMEGPEISVESLMVNGENKIIAITDKITTGAPHFVEVGHTQPSIYNEKYKAEIKNIVQEVLSCIGLKNGPSHIEIKITENGPKIVEVGLRLGGDNITSSLVPLSTGINMLEKTINLSLGNPIYIEKDTGRASAIRYLPQDFGRVERIEVPDSTLFPFYSEIVVLKHENQIVSDLTMSGDRIGYVICDGANAEEASINCDRVISHMNIKY